MMRNVLRSTLLCAGLALYLGCAELPQDPLPQFEVQRQRLEQTPPSPLTSATQAAAQITIDPVKIDPKATAGYQDLPTTVTKLFDVEPRALSVADVVTETMANNQQIKIEGYTLRVAEFEVPATKGIYDLLLGSTLQYNRNEQQVLPAQAPGGITGGRSRSADFSLSQLLPTGATINLLYDVARTSTLIGQVIPSSVTPGLTTTRFSNAVAYTQSATFGINQPLLRGFGPTVTNAAIHIAQYERRGVAADFQAGVTDQLTTNLNTYWNLIGAIEAYKVNVIAYAAALDLQRVDESKYRAGVVARTEVLQAVASAESRRDLLIQARTQVRDIEDQIKRQIFLQPGTPLWLAQIQPSQPIAWREIDIDEEGAIAVALTERPELRRAQSTIAQTQVNLDVTKNDLLPQVNLFGNVEPNGLDRDFDGSFDSLSDAKFTNYAAGVQFQYPLQNRAARYHYKEAGMRNLRAKEQLRDSQDQVVLEVRQAVRQVRTARQRIDASTSAVIAQQTKLNAELKRLDVGLSTAFVVLTFQNDLAVAQLQHIRSVIDYNQAAIALDRAMGTLLTTYGVAVTGTNLNPPIERVGFPVGLN